MVRLATGSDPNALDWTWQADSGNREVLSDDVKTCISCHSNCDGQSGGYVRSPLSYSLITRSAHSTSPT